MTDGQFDFAFAAVKAYKQAGCHSYETVKGAIKNEKIACDIYTTKTQISAVVYHG